MIILDFNQVCISNLMAQLGSHTNSQLDENMLRHMILNTVRSLNVKFRKDYGEMVIACDSRNCWRRDVYPYYKANRRKGREESELDWKLVFETLGKIRSELKEFFPYRVIDIEGCEADDVIATLVFEYTDFISTGTKILIVSGDKDFIQLHNRAGVEQFDPVRKKWITNPSPEKFLLEHILKGDAGDGVPNILSADDTFVTGTRQKPLTQKKMDALMEIGLETKLDHPAFRNFMRNKQLIDLSNTPADLYRKILDEYENQKDKTKQNMFDYFVKNKLRNLMDSIGDF